MASQTTRSTEALEFTYDWYGGFLDRVQTAGFDIRRFADGVGPGDVVLRHDVDLSLEDAVRMATFEADRGVAATYCILLTSALYNPFEGAQLDRIRRIEALGHEVAMHVSTHEYWPDGDQPADAELLDRIAEERAIVDRLRSEPTDTVSFHSPPGWVLNREFDGIRNTYAPRYFAEMTYVADSGQRWREAAPSVEDFGESAHVLTHPGLWSESDGSFGERIERAVTETCRHANSKAQREFISGGS